MEILRPANVKGKHKHCSDKMSSLAGPQDSQDCGAGALGPWPLNWQRQRIARKERLLMPGTEPMAVWHSPRNAVCKVAEEMIYVASLSGIYH